MSDKTKYSVYKHTSPDGKSYIGCTSQKPTRRWDNGNGYRYRHKEFYEDIKKFGWGNFTHEIIASGLSEDDGFRLERELIKEYRTTDPANGYNKSDGGKGPWGTVHSEEFRNKRSFYTAGSNNPMYGKPCSEERRRKISEAHKGMRHTEESIAKMREVHSKTVLCVDIGVAYPSVLDAAKAVGAFPQNISAVCCGKQKTCNGYRWKYV